MLDSLERARITYFWDRVRGAAQGISEACWQTFALLIAIRVFQAPDMVKAMLPAAFSIGFLITPITLYLLSRYQWRTGTICACLACCAAVGLIIVSQTTDLYFFIFMVLASQVVGAQIIPLVTQIYATNYPPRERGSRFSTTLMFAASMGALFSYLGGLLLDYDLNLYPVIFLTTAAAVLVAAYSFWKMPTGPLNPEDTGNPWENISLAWKDKLFGWMLSGWMLLGMCNLMLLPIRVEYMANPLYGIDATNEQVGIILGAIPLVMRIVSTKIWGYLFDRVNFIRLRVVINLIFIVSILIFFNTVNLTLMGLGSALFGIGLGGGRIMWFLWVTKIAPTGKVPVYMSVHSAFTGLRGTFAPFLGYFLLRYTGPTEVAWIAAAFGFASILIFIPARKRFEAIRLRELEQDTR